LIHFYKRKINQTMGSDDANITLSPIKVIVNTPQKAVPKTKNTDGAFEDTMFLIEVMRQKKEKELRARKENMIQEMAMEKKRKMEEEQKRIMGISHAPKVFIN